MLLANGLVAFLLATGRIDPLSLLLWVAIDGAILGAVEAVQEWLAPSALLPPPLRHGTLGRLGVAFLCASGIVFVDAFVLWAMIHDPGSFWLFLGRPFADHASASLAAPLAITLAVALLDARRDAQRLARGGAYESTPGRNAQARWLALLLGALPHAMPLLSLAAVGSGYFRRRAQRLGAAAVSAPVSRWALLALAALGIAVFLLVGWLLGSGLAGWSVAFCIGKFSSEALLLVVPRASAGETVAPRAAASAA